MLAVVIVVAFTTHHSSKPGATPTFAGVSCSERAPAEGPSGLRLTAQISDGQIFVPVCFGRRGPFAFVLDSGSVSSAISPALQSALGLRLEAGTQTVEGVTAKATAVRSRVTDWEMSGLPLRADQIDVIAAMPPGQLGLIGMDVLARLGALRVDYADARVTVAHAEAVGLPVPLAGAGVGQLLSLSSRFVQGAVHEVRTVEVPEANDLALVDVSFGAHGPFLMEVDSGNSSTEVAPWIVRQASLLATGASETLGGVGGSATGATFHAGTWGAGGNRLPQHAEVVELDLVNSKPVGGLLGGNVYADYRFVVFDFEDQLLLFGPPL